MIIMKKFFYLLALTMLTITLKAQITNIPITGIFAENVKATLQNKNLQVAWITNTTLDPNYWQVQASTDGKLFSTLGLVMGSDPKNNGNSYIFKLSMNKIKPGYKYFRVLHIESDEHAIASTITGITK